MIEVDLLRRDVTIYRHVSESSVDGGARGYRQQTVIEIPELLTSREPLVAQFDAFLDLVEGRRDAAQERAGIWPPTGSSTRFPAGGSIISESQPASTRQKSSLLGKLARHTAVRYLFVGGLSFLVDFGLLALLSQVFGWPLWIATGVAFLVSFAFTYTMQRVVAFGPRLRMVPPWPSMRSSWLSTPSHPSSSFNLRVRLCSDGAAARCWRPVVTTVWNYFSYKYWVYAHPVPAPEKGRL